MALNVPRLLVVADLDFVGEEERWIGILRDVSVAGGGRDLAIQVRAKSRSAEGLERLAARARHAVAGDVPVYLNGPVELARTLGYDGVHWPQALIPSEPAGAAGLRASAAVHDHGSLLRAERALVDFAVFGSVFTPGSKCGRGVGIAALRGMVERTTCPILAIGGITTDRTAACVAAGAAGVAVLSGIVGATSPALALTGYLDALDEAAT